MGKSYFGSESHKKDFELDISSLNGCSGVYRIEIFVPSDSVPLVVKDGSDQKIHEDYDPFLLESPVPIIKGKIKFAFQEITELAPADTKKLAIVRYLYSDE